MSDPIFRKRYLQQQTRTVREAIKGLTDSEANLVLYDAQNASLEPDGKGMMTENEENFACEMAALANKQMEEMRGMTEEQTALHVKRTIDAAQIGWGVYQDDSERGGIGLHVIKGIRTMQAVVAWGEEAAFVTDAIPCIGLDQAIAAAETWGGGRRNCNRTSPASEPQRAPSA